MKKDKVTLKFKINQEKKVITCLLTTHNDIYDILKKFHLESLCKKYTYDEYLPKKKTYVGIAKCSPEDTWDETFGKQLARYRAERARQVDVNNELKKIIKDAYRYLTNLSIYGMLGTPTKPKEKE